jgi:hypothetical protein
MMPTVYALYQKARHLSIDWWVFGGVFLLSLISSPLAACWFSTRSNRLSPADKENPSLPTDIPTNPVISLFSPLQVEAFQLAKDLREFFIGLGPRPVLEKNPQNRTDGPIERAFEFLEEKQGPWNQKLTHGYSLHFADRVYRMKHQLGEVGLSNRLFDDIENMGILNVSNIPDLAREIDRLAVDVNYIPMLKDIQKP